MKAPTLFCSAARSARAISGSRNGVALLIVLAFIVLLSVLVASYLSFSGLDRLSTASYSKSIQAQEVAQGGLQDIIADLHQEIVAGSQSSSTFIPAGQAAVYVPTTNLTAQPARMGFTSDNWTNDVDATRFAPTLVRVSRADPNGATALDFASATQAGAYDATKLPLNRASASHTDTASVNGRYISSTVWNKPGLLAAPGASLPSDYVAPDWIYTTRAGSRVCTTGEVTPPNSALKPSSSTSINSVPTVTAGSNPPANPITGRYAYIIYDEGALLDANVAGYPAAAAAPTASYTLNSSTAPAGLLPYASIINSQAARGKAYALFADLTQLPGFSSNTSLVDSLVNWRNKGGIAYASNYQKIGSDIPFLGVVFNYAQNGFLQFLSSSAGGSTDSPFLSRQDLLNYFANSNNNAAAAAVPYLGTFSRAVSAPTWAPEINSDQDVNYAPPATPTPGLAVTAPVKYKDNAETTGATNRDMANVRYSAGGTILHYRDDATTTNPDGATSSYTVSVGDPLLQNRFSLARIGWLSSSDIGGMDGVGKTNPATGNGPSAQFATAIKSCFGLVWGVPGTGTSFGANSTSTANGGNACWNYVGSGGANQKQGVIETLDQVAAENREPNFFELLKASILSGSLGLGPGPAAFKNGVDDAPASGNVSKSFANGPYDLQYQPKTGDYDGAGNLFSQHFGSVDTNTVPSVVPDIQIIKIGADIIDQYDADSYPTAIYFPYPGAGTRDPVSGSAAFAIFGPVSMVYGDENLPELARIMAQTCSPKPSGIDTPAGNYSASDDNTESVEGWLQPEIWNPHQKPPASFVYAPTAFAPIHFEIRAYGTAYTYSTTGGTTLPTSETPPPNSFVIPPEIYVYYSKVSNVDKPAHFYTGQYSSETPYDGTAEKQGTIFFDLSPGIFSFYDNPRLLVTEKDTNGSANPYAIPGVVNVSSPLTGTTGTLDQAAENYAFPNFPFYQVPQSNASGVQYTNEFVGFSTGLVSLTTEPETPFYVGQNYNGKTFTYGDANVGVSVTVGDPSGAPALSYALGWVDASSKFHPYSFITGCFVEAELTYNPGWQIGSVQTNGSSENTLAWGLVDPRTERFSTMTNTWLANPDYPGNSGSFPDSAHATGFHANTVPDTGNFTSYNYASGLGSYYPHFWSINSKTPLGATGEPVADVTYYADPDGVVRPADGIYSSTTSYDGNMLFASPGTGSTASGDTVSATSTGDVTGSNSHGRRPVILNRPFRSVGELGYVFRDEPFKTLDLFSASSADSGLLDVFSLQDESRTSSGSLSSVVAGQINMSNAPLPVLEAILAGGSKKDFDPNYNIAGTGSPSVASVIAKGVIDQLALSGASGPFLNRADLVRVIANTMSGSSASLPATDLSNKAYLESPVRALTDSVNSRTWNLMVDIIAQSGHLSSSATSLDNFSVEGERRYWLHVAIDRYTGKVLTQQLEPVYE